jgi:uncharacterized protein (DUF488 family)
LKIFTIGYQSVEVEDFIETLQKAGVTRLVDCRSKPWSRQSSFAKDKLERLLKRAGIEYRWAPKLGGKEGKRPDGWDGALNHIIERASQGKVIAVMCMEYDPTQCHRGLWLQPDLEARGVLVEHLFAPRNQPKKQENYTLDKY